jgi:hypothetical protein
MKKKYNAAALHEAMRFLRVATTLLGGGFHPDSDFADYIGADGAPVFSKRTAAALNRDCDLAFDAFARSGGPDIYQISMDMLEEAGAYKSKRRTR